ncbi:hypothetical protein JCM18750_01060 [Halostagnicola bangensis]
MYQFTGNVVCARSLTPTIVPAPTAPNLATASNPQLPEPATAPNLTTILTIIRRCFDQYRSKQ